MNGRLAILLGLTAFVGAVLGVFFVGWIFPPDPPTMFWPKYATIGGANEEGECSVIPEDLHMGNATIVTFSNHSPSAVRLTFPDGLFVQGTEFPLEREESITLKLKTFSGEYDYGISDDAGCVVEYLPGPFILIP